MSGFYGDLAVSAHDILKEFGAPATLTEVTAGDYDPATGKAALTETEHPVIAAIFDMPERRIDGTRILTGDKQVLMSTKGPSGRAITVTPRSDMKFTDGNGAVYTVKSVKPLAPALVSILFELVVRA